jgi:hypothetical protein
VSPLRRTPLQRGSVDHLARRRRAQAVMAWSMWRADVHARDDGRCVLCLNFTSLADAEIHHRKLKSRGGIDEHPNLITLCPHCHHTRVHRFPQWANAVGLMVPSWAEPADWPVLLGVHRAGWGVSLFEPVTNPRLWQVPIGDPAVWTVTAPHPDQHDEPAPWKALP